MTPLATLDLAWILDVPLGWLLLPALAIVAVAFTISEEFAIRRVERRDGDGE